MKKEPRIKICGLKDAQTIEAMDGLPIHEIGLVLAPSKRQVDKETAAELIQAVHRLKAADGERPQTVGVFVNETIEQLTAVLAVAPLDVAQLHGQETPDYCRLVREQLGVKVWKVFSIKSTEAASEQLNANELLLPYKGSIDAVLIDAPGGGTGQTFNWSAIDAFKQAAEELGLPLYVAGGLHEGNVQELLQTYSPGGIDVSSGVETEGRKDLDKIQKFVRRVIEA